MRIFNIIRLAYLEDLDKDPGVRFRIMHNPTGDWDWAMVKDLGFFDRGRVIDRYTKEKSAPRIWSANEFRYGYSFIRGNDAYIEIKHLVKPRINEETGEPFPYSPGVDSLEPADPITIWDISTKTMIFIPNGFDEMSEPDKVKYLAGLAQWLDSHKTGIAKGKIEINEQPEVFV